MAIGDQTVRIGRAPDNEIVLGHESVSRHHAEIVRSAEGWTISDLGSKNGIKINTYRTRQQDLRDGDRIEIGHIHLLVSIGAAPPTARARVVFDGGGETRERAEVLDMDSFGSLFGPSGA